MLVERIYLNLHSQLSISEYKEENHAYILMKFDVLQVDCFSLGCSTLCL